MTATTPAWSDGQNGGTAWNGRAPTTQADWVRAPRVRTRSIRDRSSDVVLVSVPVCGGVEVTGGDDPPPALRRPGQELHGLGLLHRRVVLGLQVGVDEAEPLAPVLRLDRGPAAVEGQRADRRGQQLLVHVAAARRPPPGQAPGVPVHQDHVAVLELQGVGAQGAGGEVADQRRRTDVGVLRHRRDGVVQAPGAELGLQDRQEVQAGGGAWADRRPPRDLLQPDEVGVRPVDRGRDGLGPGREVGELRGLPDRRHADDELLGRRRDERRLQAGTEVQVLGHHLQGRRGVVPAGGAGDARRGQRQRPRQGGHQAGPTQGPKSVQVHDDPPLGRSGAAPRGERRPAGRPGQAV